MRIVYATDLHGDPKHYETLFAALKTGDVLILGGDLAPNYLRLHENLALQRKFVAQSLIPGLKTLLAERSVRTYLILGNDDWAASAELIENERDLYWIADEPAGLAHWLVVGYPFVNVTPFAIKDWEKWDTEERTGDRISGYTSRGGAIRPCSLEEQQTTIAADMERLRHSVPQGPFIFVSHCPPYGTGLDRLHGGEHVGSRAIRQFILDRQPVLSLHGHIHESPKVSGRWVEELGGTLAVNPGREPEPCYVTAELDDIRGTLAHSRFGPARPE